MIFHEVVIDMGQKYSMKSVFTYIEYTNFNTFFFRKKINVRYDLIAS